MNRGRTLAQSGQWIKAVEAYSRSLEIEPNNVNASNDLKTTLNSLIDIWVSGSSGQSVTLSRASTLGRISGPQGQELDTFDIRTTSSDSLNLNSQDSEIISIASNLCCKLMRMMQMLSTSKDFHY